MPTRPELDDAASSPRLAFVDALRGLAAMAVVCVHASPIIERAIVARGDVAARLTAWLQAGALGVDVFFVISGFVIAHSIGASRVTGPFVARFALRRSIRLDPPYWLAVCAAFLVLVVQHGVTGWPEKLPGVGRVAAHFAYLYQILGYQYLSIVFWTLCLEVQFYLVFILLLWLAHSAATHAAREPVRYGAWIVVAAFVVSLAWPAALVPTDEFRSTWFGPHWYEFLAGAVLSYVARGVLPRAARWTLVSALAATVAYGSVQPAVAVFGPGVRASWWAGLASVAALAAATHGDGLRRWLAWRPLLRLGAVSYSLYLFHSPLITLIFLARDRLVPDAHPSLAVALLWFVACLAASVGVGAVLHRAIERPTIALAARFKPTAGDASLAGGIEGPATTGAHDDASSLTAAPAGSR